MEQSINLNYTKNCAYKILFSYKMSIIKGNLTVPDLHLLHLNTRTFFVI